MLHVLRLHQTWSKKERPQRYWGFYATCSVTTRTSVGIYLWPVAACPRTRQWVEPGLGTAWIRCTPAKLHTNKLGCRMLSRNNVSGVSNSLPWPSPGATVPNPVVRAGYDILDALSWMELGLPQHLDYSCPPPGLHITPIQQSGGV